MTFNTATTVALIFVAKLALSKRFPDYEEVIEDLAYMGDAKLYYECGVATGGTRDPYGEDPIFDEISVRVFVHEEKDSEFAEVKFSDCSLGDVEAAICGVMKALS